MTRKSRHNPVPPPWYRPRPPVLTAAYEREVEAASERLTADYRRACKRAEAAERRAGKAEQRAALDKATRSAKEAAERARRAAEQAWLEFQRLDVMVRERPLSANEPGRARRVGVAGSSTTALGPDEIAERRGGGAA